ncbi:GTP pyrophosphokinase [Dissulfurispira thermophila]|uniref:GTP pyrophosphokinase n=1 Tax=Dissulfurispira thermophila TaxID=2715679 RepID=A0A7G1H083_9BACT|nr:bifunctional (p)ppGpp synthetase/guanosine-3',5'-bis(diphosphate) 3'-pyrophosphohydrolase [Dissulfurispira thermophila]BCB95563.1 GTP pyrophosphokinase [Dissulfurispira thermophila]
MKTINALIEKILSYNPKADVEIIKKAYVFSRDAHCSQKRIEGSPYIHHPLAVAEILADMKLDTATIAAGLLHDTVEDTGTSTEDIKEMFGQEIAFLVDALTKLSKVEFKTKEEAQAENFRKMLLAMSKDVRVILIKFADRLHNMRTIKHLPDEKQRRIASETLDIYAPLANRLGIGWLRTEFEDLSFKTLMPDLFDDLQKKVAKRKEDQMKYIDEVRDIISEKLTAQGIPAKVKGRVKHYYGIYQKMVAQKIPFEQVHDVIGLRIITDTVSHCYDILGIIHSLWPLVPGRFKDFISLPKSNMYQSLHTTVIGPGGDRVEFQIRTDDMNEIAEEGIAAHWRYKERDSIDKKNTKFIAWLRELVKEISDAKEFLEAVKGEVIPETVYVFTPNGDIKELPIGSTPIDFAYSIHTQVGHKCIGAKANGRIVPLRYKLNSGDVVEIITSPSHGPSKDWLKFVVTQRAKSRIKQWIKTEERKQSIELGTKLVEDEIRRHGLSLSILKSEKVNEVLKYFSHQTLEDLYVSIGYGKISAHQVINRLVPEKIEKTEDVEVPKLTRPQRDKGSVITIKGIDNVLYHIAKCCFPVPGDNIVGFITKGKGVTIHRKECNNLERLAVDSERLIDVQWSRDSDVTSQTRLYIESIDKPGMLASLSALISSADVNISSLKANSTHDKRALFELTLEIKNRNQLINLVSKITQMDGVLNVRR